MSKARHNISLYHRSRPIEELQPFTAPESVAWDNLQNSSLRDNVRREGFKHIDNEANIPYRQAEKDLWHEAGSSSSEAILRFTWRTTVMIERKFARLRERLGIGQYNEATKHYSRQYHIR